MRWEALFQDLEAQFAAAHLIAVEGEIAELSRLELAALTAMDRIRAQRGVTLRIRTPGGGLFSGVVRYVGSEWLVLATGSGATMIPATALSTVEGMGRGAVAEPSEVATRLRIGSVYRAFARDRTPLTLQLASGGVRLDGTIDRVGKDFLELATVPLGEQRRMGNVAGMVLIPLSNVEAVLSHP
ncbi:hypothetical protein [Arthrobacter flavus]|uniref:Uncharacterized protein n=1 Tax=Arthrobacter flavus TaxID=95172 RepID=A0ABW4QB62_9MICC